MKNHPFSFATLLCKLPLACRLAGLLLAGTMVVPGLRAQTLRPGCITEWSFAPAEVPPTLYSLSSGKPSPATLVVRLPDDYQAGRVYPLLVYLRGRDGGEQGDIQRALSIVGTRGWIVASLPLFKEKLVRSEPYAGVIISFDDYPVLARAYEKMLGKLFEQIPNTDPKRNALVGFSNGAIPISVLLSCQNQFILEHFENFVFVEQGMFHLTGFYKESMQRSRFLMLVGEAKQAPRDGRELLLEQSRSLADTAKFFGVDFTLETMKYTGHALPETFRRRIKEWLESPRVAPQPAAPASQP